MINTILTWIAVILLAETAIAFSIVIGAFIKYLIKEMRGHK